MHVIEDVDFEKDKQLPVLDKTDIKLDKTNLQKVDNFVLKDTPLLNDKTTGGTGNSSGVGGNLNSGSNTSGGKLQQVELKVQKPSLIKPQAEMFSIK